METIYLKQTKEGYKASDKVSEMLMQHCLNFDYIELFNVSIEKLRIIAVAHGWEVVVEENNA